MNGVKKELYDFGYMGTDSKTNFLFVKYPSISGKYIFEELRKRGILVRYFGKAKIEDYMRVTIGTDENSGRGYEGNCKGS